MARVWEVGGGGFERWQNPGLASMLIASPLAGDITHENREETDKHLSGPPDSMIASQWTETEAGLEISIKAAGNQELGS